MGLIGRGIERVLSGDFTDTYIPPKVWGLRKECYDCLNQAVKDGIPGCSTGNIYTRGILPKETTGGICENINPRPPQPNVKEKLVAVMSGITSGFRVFEKRFLQNSQ